MPKILKLPKPPPNAEKQSNNGAAKPTALAEIIFFPNGKDDILQIKGAAMDFDTEPRWLRLAGDALDGRGKRKKA
jgi:hypothetical protein